MLCFLQNILEQEIATSFQKRQKRRTPSFWDSNYFGGKLIILLT